VQVFEGVLQEVVRKAEAVSAKWKVVESMSTPARARWIWEQLFGKGYYVLLTLANPMLPGLLGTALGVLYGARRTRWGLGCMDMARAVLFMLGRKACGSGLHFDRTSAVNVAMRTDKGLSLDAPLAQWMFLHPRVFLDEDLLLQLHAALVKMDVVKAGDVVEENIFAYKRDAEYHESGALKRKKKPLLSLNQVEELRFALGEENVIILYQKHGQVVFVPPGYAHQVINLEDCMKMAFDFIDPKLLAEYAVVWRRMICRLAGSGAGDDYRGVAYELEMQTTRTLIKLGTEALSDDGMTGWVETLKKERALKAGAITKMANAVAVVAGGDVKSAKEPVKKKQRSGRPVFDRRESGDVEVEEDSAGDVVVEGGLGAVAGGSGAVGPAAGSSKGRGGWGGCGRGRKSGAA
jgi:hypothetical protein